MSGHFSLGTNPTMTNSSISSAEPPVHVHVHESGMDRCRECFLILLMISIDLIFSLMLVVFACQVFGWSTP